MGQRLIDVKTVYSAQEIGGGTIAYSSLINSYSLIPDYAALQLKMTTTATLTIAQQVSLDGEIWQDPTTSTSVASGFILTGFTNATGAYIAFTPVIAPYLRLKLTALTTVASATIKVVIAGNRE